MDDIPLEDEPFEQFDNYDDYEEQMMNEAERQDQLYSNSTSNVASASSSSARNFNSSLDSLPQQRDYLSILQGQSLQAEQELERIEKQKQQQQQQRDQQRGQGSGKRQTIGRDAPGEDEVVDLGAVKVGKKRVKLVKLDNERLMSDHGLSLLMANGKRFRIRSKYRDSTEKNANVATMEGWRDAYWNAIKEEREAKENAIHAETEELDLQTNVWNEHEKELQTQRSSSTPMTIDTSGKNALPSEATRPKPRPAASKKGKEKAIDAPSASTAMRLAASDDDEDDVDYERALNRMRISNNIDIDSRDHVGPSARKNEIDLDDYNSEVEEDDEEDAPLFTHRALQMMGAPETIAILGANIPPPPKQTSIPEGIDPDDDGSELILNGNGTPPIDAATIEFESNMSMPTLPLEDFSSIDEVSGIAGSRIEGVQNMDVYEDDEDTVIRHKPTKGRRAILLDSSDEE
ncbi:hypothetical protein BGZ76_000687 [Entomortierella beljakovae]|nr:hypothetical protein BGZ76_000687 [Entomortierella beljakovae]